MANINKLLWTLLPGVAGAGTGAALDHKSRLRGATIGGVVGAGSGFGTGANYASIMNAIIKNKYVKALEATAYNREFRKGVDDVSDAAINAIRGSRLPGKSKKIFMTEIAPKIKAKVYGFKSNLGRELVSDSKLSILPEDHMGKIINFPGLKNIKSDAEILGNAEFAVDANLATIAGAFKRQTPKSISKLISKDIDSRLSAKDIIVGRAGARTSDISIKDVQRNVAKAQKVYNDFQTGGTSAVLRSLIGIKATRPPRTTGEDSVAARIAARRREAIRRRRGIRYTY